MEPELEYRVILHGPMKWKVSEPLKNVVCVNTPYLVIYEPMAGILQLSQGTLTINSFKMYGSKRDGSQILSIWLFASLDDAEMAVTVLSKMLMEKCTIVDLCKLSEATSVLCKALTSFHLLLEFVINNIKRSLSEKAKIPKDVKLDPILESYRKCGIMGSFSLRVGLFDVVLQVNEKTDLMEHLYRGMEHKGAGINRLSFSFYEVSQSRGHTFNNFLGYDLFTKNARNMSDPINIDLLNNMTNISSRSITTNVNPGEKLAPAIMPAINSSSSRSYCNKVTIPTSQANRSPTLNTVQVPNEMYKQLYTTYGSPVSIVNRCLNNSTSKYPPILNDTSAGDKVLGVIDLDNSPTNDNFYYPVDDPASPNTPTINSYPSTTVISSENPLDNAGLSIDTNEWVDKRLYNDLIGRFKTVSEDNTKWQEKYQHKVTKLNTQMNEVRQKYANELEKLKYNYDTEVLSLKGCTEELKERYEAQIAIIRNNNEKEILKLRCSYEDAIEDLKNKHQNFIKNLQLKHDNEINELLMVHDNNINDLKKNYQTQLDMMKRSFDNEIDMKKKGYDAEIVEMRRVFQNEIVDLKRSQQIELRDNNSLTYNVMEENEELCNKVKVLQNRVLVLENEIKRLENFSKMQELNHFRDNFQLQDTKYKIDLGDLESNNDLLRREMERIKEDWTELYSKLSARLFYSMIAQMKLKRECALLKLQNTFLRENRNSSTNPLINTIMRCKGKIAKRTCQLHRIVEVLGLSGPTTITGITTRIQLLNQMVKGSKCGGDGVKPMSRNGVEALERKLRKFSEILENQRFSIEKNDITSISDFKKKRNQLLAQNELLVREIKEMFTMIVHSSPQGIVSKNKRTIKNTNNNCLKV